MFDLNIFRVTDINHIRIFLTLFCISLAMLLTVSLRRQWHFFNTNPVRIYGQPKAILARIQPPILSINQFRLIGVVLIISLLVAVTGILPRLFLFLALISYFLYFSQIMPLATVRRKSHLIPIILLVLLVAPAINAPWLQPTPQWPLLLVKIALVQIYLSAGLQKLRHAGIRWADGRSMQAYLLEHHLWGDMPYGFWLAKHRRLCTLVSILVFVFELTVWTILFWPQLTLFYVFWGIAFHVATAVTMHIYYIKYLTPVYMVFATDAVAQLLHIK